MKKILFSVALLVLSMTAFTQVPAALQAKLDQQVRAIEPKVIEWRRHFHQYPELSNRETKTGAYLAEYLKGLGLEVTYPVAKTGVVALLKTGKPGPVIALRSDIDALPVTERNSLPFASKEKVTFNGQETGVMHACGHDSHMAMLMGVADILVKNKSELRGIIKFIFQPAEEGPPKGEEGGALLMIKEGVLENPKVDVIFGQHIWAAGRVGDVWYRPGGFMAAADQFTIRVKGRQAHGSAPWMGVDPIVISAQIITGLQTIISRQSELTKGAAVITVGRLHSGIRENIIPEESVMSGTIRTFDEGMRDRIHESIRTTATRIAESGGATAEVETLKLGSVTYNDLALTEKMIPSIQKAVGKDHAILCNAVTGAEDFADFQKVVPGLFFFTGGSAVDKDATKIADHHTPDFMLDEAAFITGVKTMLALTVDYMYMKK
ncbi:MAG: amidohydrolase [Cytophagales bacterium]|nr:amidohydrolase [Cytophagales bacterium]